MHTERHRRDDALSGASPRCLRGIEMAPVPALCPKRSRRSFGLVKRRRNRAFRYRCKITGQTGRYHRRFPRGRRLLSRLPVYRKKVNWTTPIPLTILIGEADDWTPASLCSSLVNRACRDGAPVDIVIYSEAHHAFDAPDQPLRVRSGLAHTARRDGKATIGTNPAARADAIERVQHILARHLR